MNGQELFEALDEYYEAKHKKEIDEGFGWRIAERILIVALAIVPAVFLLLKAPVFELDGETYNCLETKSIFDESLDEQDEDPTISYAEYYSFLSGFVSLAALVMVGSGVMMVSVNGHTKHRAIESIGLMVGIDSLLLAIIQYIG